MNKHTQILLVEDKTEDIELILAALDEARLAGRVVIARGGVEALEYLRCTGKFAQRVPGDPAVVLLDMKMPRLGGLEVLRAIKSDPQLKKIPVVMLTSSREQPDVEQSYELGVNAYVVKPLDFFQFTEAIQRLAAFWAGLNELPPDSRLQEARL